MYRSFACRWERENQENCTLSKTLSSSQGFSLPLAPTRFINVTSPGDRDREKSLQTAPCQSGRCVALEHRRSCKIKSTPCFFYQAAAPWRPLSIWSTSLLLGQMTTSGWSTRWRRRASSTMMSSSFSWGMLMTMVSRVRLVSTPPYPRQHLKLKKRHSESTFSTFSNLHNHIRWWVSPSTLLIQNCSFRASPTTTRKRM